MGNEVPTLPLLDSCLRRNDKVVVCEMAVSTGLSVGEPGFVCYCLFAYML